MKWIIGFVWMLGLAAIAFSLVLDHYDPSETCAVVCQQRGYTAGLAEWRWHWVCKCRSERRETVELP